MINEGGGASRSTDPAAGTSAATDVSLREHLTSLIENSRQECKANVDSLRAQVLQAETSGAEQIKTALASIDKRFENVNEFREALSDLSKRMATQDAVANLADKIIAGDEALEVRFEALYQRNRDDITILAKRVDVREGQAAGSRLTMGNLIALVTVGVAIIGVIVVLANYLSGS